MAKSKLVGQVINGTVVEIFATVSNTELNEGRGRDKDIGYYFTEEGAQRGGKGRGVMGSGCKVEKRLAIRLEDGNHLILATSGLRFYKGHYDNLPKIKVK